MADPLAAGLRQPDQRSCGAASVVMARALRDPSYGDLLVVPGRFRAEVLAVHGALTSRRDRAGHPQLPWPRALGTPPWAVARELALLTGADHDVDLVRWRRQDTFDRLSTVGGVLFVGNAWLPRHVVLVLPGAGDAARCYNPSSGRVVRFSRAGFVGGRLALGRWQVPWFTVV